jgi:Uma2 family endonuclease
VCIAKPATFTAVDLLMMPDGDRYELVHGNLVERKKGAEQSWVAGRIHPRLDAFIEPHGLGWAFPDGTSYQSFPDDSEEVRKPDALFVARARFPDETSPRGHCRVAPDLAVKVVSPRDLYYEVDENVEYLNDSGIVSGNDVLPGFTCRVGEFFSPRTTE